MWIKRAAIWLYASAAFVLLAGNVLAQPSNSNLPVMSPRPSYENGSAPYSEDDPRSGHPLLPFHPMGFESEAEPFAPAETSGYGNGPRPHIGYWASYERVFWSLSKPSAGFVGSPTAERPLNVINVHAGTVVSLPYINPSAYPDGPTVDNGFISATGAWGNRWELGYIDTDNYGWMASILDHVSQGQYRIANNPLIGFNDPARLLHPFFFQTIGVAQTFVDAGEVPTPFVAITMKNLLQLNGLELMRIYRAPQLHNGGYFTLLYGARWIQINDTFFVQGFGNGANIENLALSLAGTTTPLSFSQNLLDASSWSTRALNSVIGPQIGGRWENQRGRWLTSMELRVMTGANFQSVTQKTNLGTQALQNKTIDSANINIAFIGIGTNTHQFTTTFAPAGEIRFQTTYEVTKNVGLKIGYTGLVVGNISRASNRVDYGSPNLIGILSNNTHQLFFSNGINMGIEFNR